MSRSITWNKITEKLFDKDNFILNQSKLNLRQKLLFSSIFILTLGAKLCFIKYNMFESGDNATRVWNALWWAEKPFFVLPASGHPLWFYFMGGLIKVTGEIYYTPIITMTLLVTVAAVFIYKSTLLISNFGSALLAYIIVTLNPIVFRLNYLPYPQQLFLAASCAMLYFLLKALLLETSIRYFISAGIVALFALASRPEIIFLIIPLIIFSFLTRKKGAIYFAVIPLTFQIFWIILSFAIYGSFFKSFEIDADYAASLSFHGLSLSSRLRGLFIPYYFLFLGLTLLPFYYFVRGIIFSYGTYPKSITVLISILIFVPFLTGGIAGMKSELYQSTNYIYLPFFVSPIIIAIKLYNDLVKIKLTANRTAFAAVVILSCIPLSFIKEIVPKKYNKLFPKVIEFIVTADEPQETRNLITFIDAYIEDNPALIFDADDNKQSILYVPFRTKLATPNKILISSYNVPFDKEGLTLEIERFMKKNPKGIIMIRKTPTIMHMIFDELLNNKPYKRNDVVLQQETDKWYIYVYGQTD